MHYILEIKDFLNVLLHVIRYFNNVHTQARLKLRRHWLDSAFFKLCKTIRFLLMSTPISIFVKHTNKYTEVEFTSSFWSGRFTSLATVNPLDGKLINHNSV